MEESLTPKTKKVFLYQGHTFEGGGLHCAFCGIAIHNAFKVICLTEDQKKQADRQKRQSGRVREEINHPDHYGGDTPYEAIKVIEAWDLGFNLGNALKYIRRAGIKNQEDALKDLQKAAWYLQREIDNQAKKSMKGVSP